jgi:hypothetical protein
MTPALLAMAMQALPAPTLERWEDLAVNGQNRVAVDPQSISRTGNRATLIIRSRAQQAAGMMTAVTRYRYDCAANLVTRESMDIYAQNGAFLGTVGVGRQNQSIPAASLQATLRNVACGESGQ